MSALGFSTGKYIHTYALIPTSCLFIGSCRTHVVAKLDFVELAEILLVGSCPAEVTLAAVVCNGLI